MKLNGCIQALRNVTFVLQKEKRLITDFDAWYEPWRRQMQSDPIMRWVVKSRNRIVKEGDLETNSEAVGRLVVSYYGAADEVRSGLGGAANIEAEPQDVRAQVKPPPRFSTKQIVDELASRNTPQRLLDQATITVERRWVDRALPDHELLDALAAAFGVLSTLIADAHARLGIAPGLVIAHDDQEFHIEPDTNWLADSLA